MPADMPPAPPATPATLSLDQSDESATTALYRAAIGPVGADHYRPVFARFDLADRAGSGWNWAACLCTVGWMVFRRMWGAALAYVGVVVVVALFSVVLVGLVFQAPAQVRLGIGAALLLVTFVVPGVWGDAWLFAHSRKRMARALADSSSWAEAVVLLERQAVQRPRAWWLGTAHVVLLAAGLAVYFAVPGLPSPESVRVAGAGTPDGGAPIAAAASTPVAATAAPAAAPASTPLVSTVHVPVPAPSQAAEAVPKPVPVAQGLSRYFVNVGLFAVDANARKAHASLRAAGVPVQLQTLQMKNGKRTRVRVGPYQTRGQAEAAAEKILTLGLEAQVFRQEAER